VNVHYTGRQAELSEAQRKKLEVKFGKIQKILGGRLEPEAHVIFSMQRGRYSAEITLNFRHHTAVVECSGPDLLAAAQEALDKLAQQVVREKDRWREKKRRAGSVRELPEPVQPAARSKRPRQAARANGQVPQAPRRAGATTPQVLHTSSPMAKPLTVEEAMLEMEQDNRDCVVYQDVNKRRLAVLFRRRDGHLELIES